jgi:hypothetical protein
MVLVRRPFVAALGLCIALTAGGTLPAPAQVVPADAPAVAAPALAAPALAAPAEPTAASQTVAQGTPRRENRPRRRASLIDLTITPIKSYAIGADQLAPPGTLSDNQIGINGLLNINFARHWHLYERRENHFDLVGRTFKSGKPSYSGFGPDLEYDTGLSYDVTPDINLGEEFMYRWRVCCPGSGDPTNSNPRVEQGLRTNLSVLLGPRTRIGKILRIYGAMNYVNHHPNLGLKLPGGTPVLGKTWVPKIGATVQAPIFNQSRVVPFFTVEHYSDFYNNNLTPSMTNRTYYGVRLPGNSFMSSRFFVKSEHQTNPGGDVSHKVELYLETSFKFHS